MGNPVPASHGPSAGPSKSLHILHTFDAGREVLGVAPFGPNLALLALETGPGPSQAESSAPQQAERQPEAAPDASGAAAAERQPGEGPAAGPGAADVAEAGEAHSGSPGAEAGAAGAAEAAEGAGAHVAIRICSCSGQVLATEPVGSRGLSGSPSGHLGLGSCRLEVFYSASLLAGRPFGGSRLASQASAASVGTPPPGSPARAVPAAAASAAATPSQSPQASPVRGMAAARGDEGAAAAAAVTSTEGEGEGEGAGSSALQQYKWWRDGDEPVYFIVAPKVQGSTASQHSAAQCSTALPLTQHTCHGQHGR